MDRRRFRVLPVLLILLLLLPVDGCSSAVHSGSPWQAGDLRLLDPPAADQPAATDILAVLARRTSREVQIRVDLLDLALDDEYCLVVKVYEGQSEQPLTVVVTGQKMTFSLPEGHMSIRPRVVRDPWIDVLTISYNRLLLEEELTFTVSTYANEGESEPLDATPRLDVDGDAPTGRAQVLIAFTDVFAAGTPAQAFRRWDGAHTGPTGERHGLLHLLTAVRAWQIPVVLADLKTADRLAALDFAGGMELLRTLAKEDLLLLPDVAAAAPGEEALAASREAAEAFGLASSPFAYAVSGDTLAGVNAQFAVLPGDDHLLQAGATRLIPLPGTTDPYQVNQDGPTLDVRRTLAAAATAGDPAALVVLGGSLPSSPWGDSDMASPAFEWLAAHPWVEVLDGARLAALPTMGEALPLTTPAAADPFLAALNEATTNAITESAWRVHFLLAAPTSDAALLALRQNYFGQIGVLLAASAWAEAPYAIQSCETDLDLDGRGECVLADEATFAVIETDGGRLSHLFRGGQQLVGPTAQFQVGLSDPSAWLRQAGDGADPAQVMGAFQSAVDPYLPLTPRWEGQVLVLSDPGGRLKRSYRLEEGGIAVRLEDSTAGLFIPLAVDPGCFYSGDCPCQAERRPDSWTWGPAGGLRVQVSMDVPYQAWAFTASLPFLGLPEDPDLDYPPGHYLPFPLSMLSLPGGGVINVTIHSP